MNESVRFVEKIIAKYFMNESICSVFSLSHTLSYPSNCWSAFRVHLGTFGRKGPHFPTDQSYQKWHTFSACATVRYLGTFSGDSPFPRHHPIKGPANVICKNCFLAPTVALDGPVSGNYFCERNLAGQ